MALNKVPVIPFQELPNTWFQDSRVHNDVDTIVKSYLVLNPTSGAGGHSTKDYGASNDGQSAAAMANRVITIASGPPIASAATGQLAQGYEINSAELSWDQISTLTTGTGSTANAGFINVMLAKLSTSQAVTDSAAYGAGAAGTTFVPLLGLSWPFLAGTASVGPGLYNGTLLARDTSTMTANASGIITTGRLVFNLKDDIAATVAAHGLTRTLNSNRLLPGERLVVVLTPVKSTRAAYDGTAAKVFALNLQSNVILQKIRI